MNISAPHPVTRFACNRCHEQKLRCPRNPIPGQPCGRCANAGAVCKFEPPLRPGRPSTRRRKSSRKTSLSPSQSLTGSSSVTPAGEQERDLATSCQPKGYMSELDCFFENMASECPLVMDNNNQGMWFSNLIDCLLVKPSEKVDAVDALLPQVGIPNDYSL